MCSFLPTINPTCKVDGYSYISWMLYVYSIGAYIKLSDRKILRCKSSAYFILFAVVAVLSITVTIFANTYITTKIGNYLFDMYMVNILLASVLLFLAFLKLDIGYCKIINIFAAQTFGVYLLHDDPYVRTFLWNNLFRAFELGKSNYLILHMFGCSILVWIIGVMVHFVWGKIKATVKRK